MSKHNSTSTRSVILEKACQLVSEKGVSFLTLEAAAKEAGISKGGLLYHFSSKEALIEGMINYLTDNYNATIEKKVAEEPDTTGQWLRAFVRMSFEEAKQNDLLGAGLLATMVNNPELLNIWRECYYDWQSRIEEDSHDLALSTLIRLAADGLWFSELLGFAPPDPKLRDQLLATMLELTEQGSIQKADQSEEI